MRLPMFHEQRRLRTRLRNLKKEVKNLGRRGKLTGKLIDELSVYYGLVIRRNTSRRRRFLVQVFDVVQKIYEDLTRGDPHSRCLDGFTQNANSSLNAVDWSIAPETISSGKSVVDIATNITVITYNDGFRGLLDVTSTLELRVNSELYNFFVEVDQRRIKTANRSVTKNRSERPYVAQKRSRKAKLMLGRAVIWCWVSRVKVKKITQVDILNISYCKCVLKL